MSDQQERERLMEQLRQFSPHLYFGEVEAYQVVDFILAHEKALLDRLEAELDDHVIEMNPAEDDRNGANYTEEYYRADDVRSAITAERGWLR